MLFDQLYTVLIDFVMLDCLLGMFVVAEQLEYYTNRLMIYLRYQMQYMHYYTEVLKYLIVLLHH